MHKIVLENLFALCIEVNCLQSWYMELFLLHSWLYFGFHALRKVCGLNRDLCTRKIVKTVCFKSHQQASAAMKNDQNKMDFDSCFVNLF